MARIRTNFWSGTLTSAISDSDTSISCAALASFPVVASPYTALVSIDSELLEITAHTASATTATVTRGKDGTTKAAHAAGATVLQAPVASDFNYPSFNIPGEVPTMSRRDVLHTSLGTGDKLLRLAYFVACDSITANNVRVVTGDVAAAATPTLIRFGLYSVATNGNLTLIASTANDTSLLAATYTNYTKAFSTPVALVEGTTYAFGILVVTAATAPKMAGRSLGVISDAVKLPTVTGYYNNQSDLPASIAVGDIWATNTLFYAAFTP